MLHNPQQSAPLPPPPPSVQQPLQRKGSTDHVAQVDEMTLEQQVLLVSLEDDPQPRLQPGSREAEVKEVKETAITLKDKDTIKPKSRAGSIGTRSKDALSAISKRFSPPPSRSQSTSSPSTPAPTPVNHTDAHGTTSSTDESGSVSHLSLTQTGSFSGSPFKDHSRHHTDSATLLPQHTRRSRSSLTSSCSVSSASSSTSTSSSPSSSVFFSPTAFYSSLFSPKHSTSSHSHSHSHSNSVNPLSPTSTSNGFPCVTSTPATTTPPTSARRATTPAMMAHRASFAEMGSLSLLVPGTNPTAGTGTSCDAMNAIPISRQTRSASCTRLFPMSSSASFSSLAMMSSQAETSVPSELLSIPGNDPGSETYPIEEGQAPLAPLYPSQAPITANPDSLFNCSLIATTVNTHNSTFTGTGTGTSTSTTLDRRPSPTSTSSLSLSFFPVSSPPSTSSALFPSLSSSSSSSSSSSTSSTTAAASASSSSASSMLPPLPLFPSLPLSSSFLSTSTPSNQNHPHHPHHPHLPYFDDSPSFSLSHSLSLTPASSTTTTSSTSTAITSTSASIMGAPSPALHSNSAHSGPTGNNNGNNNGGAMATYQPLPHSHAQAHAHSHSHSHSHSHHPFAHPHGASGLSFEASVQGLELSLPGKATSSMPIANSNCSLMPPASPMSSSFNSDSGFPSGSRRSSKDSVDSVPGVTLDVLVDQLTIPDYINSIEQITRTKVFLMIYRKFLRPRELLEMFIERFEELGEFVDDDDEEAKNTRLRICACLYYWLKNHPNDLIHRQTRQRVASFLRERVALFPCLAEIYSKLLPLSSIHYFNTWRWPQADHSSDSRSSSISGPTLSGSISDEDSDSGFYDAATAAHSEQEMDEDREWGLFDEDEPAPDAKVALTMESISAPFSPSSLAAGSTGFNLGNNIGNNASRLQAPSFVQLPRDRRSSTGSLAHHNNSPCAMEAFVASRRGSASSVSSSQSHTPNNLLSHGTSSSFAEGYMTPLQLQPMTSIPFINKRSSSQAYRQKVQQQQQQQSQQQQRNASPVPPLHQGMVSAGSSAAQVFKETVDEPVGGGGIHPFQGKALPLLPPPVDYLTMNMSFLEIPDGAIAAQLTCIEFLLFRKLKPRDMLRQVWKTSKGSAAFQACIAHFNFISSWVGTMILSQAKVKNRAKMMEKFISIAKLLRDMGNFNTTMAIIGAMNTSSIHRLMQTRELLQGKEIWATFNQIEHLMSSERSFFEYRAALKAQKLPCIPYLGVHLGDLLSISEGNRDFRQDGSIHWQKFCLLTEVISTVIHFQSEPYMIQPDPFISRAITDTHVLDDEEMYTKSVGAEPGKLHHSRSLSKFNFF